VIRRAQPALGTLACAGCGLPAALDAASMQAGAIARLWWWFAAVCAAVWIAVIAVMLIAVLRRRRDGRGAVDGGRHAAAVGIATGGTVLVLLGLLAASIVTGERLVREHERDPLRIEVTARQWWWSVRYPSEPASDTVETANEIHVPAGRTVRLELRSADVIHSLWVPRLHGKRDLIPGHLTELRFRVDQPGAYVGQCAEFCGHQHAHMLIRLVAEPPDVFDAWLRRQRGSARPPATPEEERGRSLFATRSCALCHAIRGTEAGGRNAPDLTHVASRTHLASGILPNTRDGLTRWVRDPQALKPGTRMPSTTLSDDELRALVAYLASLA
jgi:cytochrome c oxidase subunit 2